jgi:hypothetical protein
MLKFFRKIRYDLMEKNPPAMPAADKPDGQVKLVSI